MFMVILLDLGDPSLAFSLNVRHVYGNPAGFRRSLTGVRDDRSLGGQRGKEVAIRIVIVK